MENWESLIYEGSHYINFEHCNKALGRMWLFIVWEQGTGVPFLHWAFWAFSKHFLSLLFSASWVLPPPCEGGGEPVCHLFSKLESLVCLFCCLLLKVQSSWFRDDSSSIRWLSRLPEWPILCWLGSAVGHSAHKQQGPLSPSPCFMLYRKTRPNCSNRSFQNQTLNLSEVWLELLELLSPSLLHNKCILDVRLLLCDVLQSICTSPLQVCPLCCKILTFSLEHLNCRILYLGQMLCFPQILGCWNWQG